MPLRDKILQWLFPGRAVLPIVDLQEAAQQVGPVVPVQVPAVLRLQAPSGNRAQLDLPPLDFDLLTRAVRSDSYLYQAVCKYVDLIFKEGWDLKSKNPRALEYVRARLRIASASTGIPMPLLLQSVAEDLVIYGNAYLLKARQSGSYTFPRGIRVAQATSGRPPVVGYFALPVATIQVERDAKGQVTRYAQLLPGQAPPKYIQASDVVHFAWKPPRGEVYGYPFLLAALEDARMLRKIEDDLLRLIHIHTYPIQVLQVGLDSPGKQATKEEVSELRAEARQWSPEETLILTERHKIYLVGAQGEALDLSDYLRYAEQRLFTALGVPETVMGRGSTSNRATADILAAEMHDAVKSYQRLIATVFTHHVLTELLYEGGFDPVLRPDDQVELAFREIAIDERIKQETHALYKYEHNATTFTEMRYEIGMDPEVDEADMYLERHQIPLAYATRGLNAETGEPLALLAGTRATNNKIRPTNQHGTKTSPKRTTGSSEEEPLLYEVALRPTIVRPRISVVGRQLRTLWKRLGDDLAALATSSDPKAAQLLGQELELTRQAMLDVLEAGIGLSLDQGARTAQAPDAPVRSYRPRLGLAAEQDLIRLLSDLEPFFHRAVAQRDASAVREGLSSLDFRIDRIADFRLRQAFHTGVLAALSARRFASARVVTPANSSCEACLALQDRIALTVSGFDPASGPLPAHPHCNCYYAPEE